MKCLKFAELLGFSCCNTNHVVAATLKAATTQCRNTKNNNYAVAVTQQTATILNITAGVPELVKQEQRLSRDHQNSLLQQHNQQPF